MMVSLLFPSFSPYFSLFLLLTVISLQTDEEKRSRAQALTLHGAPIDSLGLDFTLPGSPDIELRPRGSDIPVTIFNLHEYIAMVTHCFLIESVAPCVAAFREGFNIVFPVEDLKVLRAEEIDMILNGQEEQWDIDSTREGK